MKWEDDTLVLGDIRFRCTHDPNVYHAAKSSDAEFLVVKDRFMVEKLLSAIGAKPRTILEFGVWQGGSTVLFDQLYAPERLVAIERNPRPIEPLERYRTRFRREQALDIRYGMDQADAPAISEIISEKFDGSIDLILDDASHFYEESRASFLATFPFLAPGGKYIVEDWGWSHSPAEHWTRPYFENKCALTNLLVDVSVLSTVCHGIIGKITVHPSFFSVERGAAPLATDGPASDPAGLAQHIRSHGKLLEPFL